MNFHKPYNIWFSIFHICVTSAGNLKGKLSRRINKQHRLVYEIFENEKKVKYQAIISPNSQQEKLWQFEITNLRDAQLFLSD